MTKGYPPSVREIGKSCRFKLNSNCTWIFSKIRRKKGYIKKQDKKR